MVNYLDGINMFTNVEISTLNIYQNIEPYTYTSVITSETAPSQIDSYLFNYADTSVIINQGKIYDLTLHENASATIIDIISSNNSILQDQSKKLTSGIVIGPNAVLTVASAYLNNLSLSGMLIPSSNVILNDVQFGPSGCIYFNENATVTGQNIQITQLDTQLNNFNVLSGNTIDILTGTVNFNNDTGSSNIVSLAGSELTDVNFNVTSGQLSLNYNSYNNVTLSGDYNTFNLVNLTELNTSNCSINFYGVQNTLSIYTSNTLSVGITETDNIFDENIGLKEISFSNTSICYVQNQTQNTLDALNINIPVNYESCSHIININLNINNSASIINNIFSDVELIINGSVVRFK